MNLRTFLIAAIILLLLYLLWRFVILKKIQQSQPKGRHEREEPAAPAVGKRRNGAVSDAPSAAVAPVSTESPAKEPARSGGQATAPSGRRMMSEEDFRALFQTPSEPAAVSEDAVAAKPAPAPEDAGGSVLSGSAPVETPVFEEPPVKEAEKETAELRPLQQEAAPVTRAVKAAPAEAVFKAATPEKAAVEETSPAESAFAEAAPEEALPEEAAPQRSAPKAEKSKTYIKFKDMAPSALKDLGGFSRVIAINVEAPNSKRDRICNMGMTIADTKTKLSTTMQINPEEALDDIPNGMNPDDILSAPTFEMLWPELSRLLDGSLVIAHNTAYDLSILKKAILSYDLPCPSFSSACTYRMSRKFHPEYESYKLGAICEKCGIDLEVGNAVSHSDACYGIFTKLIEEGFPVFSEAKPFSLK